MAALVPDQVDLEQNPDRTVTGAALPNPVVAGSPQHGRLAVFQPLYRLVLLPNLSRYFLCHHLNKSARVLGGVQGPA